jgi:eukaryotic-like serine/threonine-protein kinase
MNERPFPEMLDEWHLESLIHKGTAADVYAAWRDQEGVRQRAAVKIFRRVVESTEWREAQALEEFRKPGIARLLSQGRTPENFPFVAVEYADGANITRFADERGLSPDDRLVLFLQACEAVNYLHDRLWYHTDLKPDNIRVTHDGVVKIIDFGDAIQPGRFETPVGARRQPDIYASPETLDGASCRESDIYSLGAVLYELLSGHPPFNPSLRAESLHHAVLNYAPMAPSEAVTRPKQASGANINQIAPEGLAAMRGGLPLRELQKWLRRGPDRICLYALRKSPRDRYRYVYELSDDVRSVLKGRRPRFAGASDHWPLRLEAVRRNPLAAAGVIAAAAGAFSEVVSPGDFAKATRETVALQRQCDEVADRSLAQLREELRPALAAAPGMEPAVEAVDDVIRSAAPRPRALTPLEKLRRQQEALQELEHQRNSRQNPSPGKEKP